MYIGGTYVITLLFDFSPVNNGPVNFLGQPEEP